MDYKAVDLRSELSCSFSTVSPGTLCSEFYEGCSSWDSVFSSQYVFKSQLENPQRPFRDLLETVLNLNYCLSHTCVTSSAAYRSVFNLELGFFFFPLSKAPCLHANVSFSIGYSVLLYTSLFEGEWFHLTRRTIQNSCGLNGFLKQLRKNSPVKIYPNRFH